MRPRSSYARHSDFVAPARATAQIWRLLLGSVLAAASYVALGLGFFSVMRSLGVLNGAPRAEVLVLLLSFACMALAVMLAAQIVHLRSIRTLFGPMPEMLRDFGRVSGAVLALMAAVFVLPPWGMGDALIQNQPLGTWLLLLLPGLAAILVQAGSEEIVFRGYLQQQLAARFDQPWIWMLVPSVIFAMGHYLPREAGENAMLLALWSGVFGLLMADLTARSGNLGPAIAVHLWNNASAILLISMPGDLSALALYLTPFTLADTEAVRAWLPVEFAMSLVYWLAARLAIRR